MGEGRVAHRIDLALQDPFAYALRARAVSAERAATFRLAHRRNRLRSHRSTLTPWELRPGAATVSCTNRKFSELLDSTAPRLSRRSTSPSRARSTRSTCARRRPRTSARPSASTQRRAGRERAGVRWPARSWIAIEQEAGHPRDQGLGSGAGVRGQLSRPRLARHRRGVRSSQVTRLLGRHTRDPAAQSG